jgi:hypothetical protein
MSFVTVFIEDPSLATLNLVVAGGAKTKTKTAQASWG